MSYLYVDSSRCTVCGACADICPAGAIGFVDGVAAIDQARCDLCQKCLTSCRNGAIVLALEPARERLSRSDVKTDTPVVADSLNPLADTFRSQLLPLAGSALLLLGKQLVPHMLPHFLDVLDRRVATRRVATSDGMAILAGVSGGHRFRGRHRRP